MEIEKTIKQIILLQKKIINLIHDKNIDELQIVSKQCHELCQELFDSKNQEKLPQYATQLIELESLDKKILHLAKQMAQTSLDKLHSTKKNLKGHRAYQQGYHSR